MKEHMLLVFICLFLFSCSDNGGAKLLYKNDFDNLHALDDVSEINSGDFYVTFEEGADGSNACLESVSDCASMMMIIIGPLEQDYLVWGEVWMKSQYGSKMHLQNRDVYENITLETSSEYDIMRQWNHFKTGTIEILEGQSIRIYLNPSNSTFGLSWYDGLKIYGEAIN